MAVFPQASPYKQTGLAPCPVESLDCQINCVPGSCLLLGSCVALGELLNLSKPPFLHHNMVVD